MTSADEPPRIGVFVCNCGINIGGVADVPAHCPNMLESKIFVTYVEENLFSCSQDTQDKMVEVIKEQKLNRIVVAACTPRTHEPLFQETMLYGMQVSMHIFLIWPISGISVPGCTRMIRKAATEKSKDLVRMAVGGTEPLCWSRFRLFSVEIDKLGTGSRWWYFRHDHPALHSLADQGFPGAIVEKSSNSAVLQRILKQTWKGQDVKRYLAGLGVVDSESSI